jgi:GR25 family glycosyltransferase involved in LPS biosynthesis
MFTCKSLIEENILYFILLILLFLFLYISFFIIPYNLYSNRFENFNNQNETNMIDYYVIHIRSYTKRYKNILNNQSKLNQGIKIFDGVIGKNLDLNDLSMFDPELKMNFDYTYINEIGCYLSHIMLIKSLIGKDNGYTVVFEDDFIILDNNLHKKINNILNTISDDFDLIYLGNLSTNYKNKYKNDIYYIDANNNLWGTHAYIINNKNAQKIYNLILNMDKAIDNKYKELIDKKLLNAFTIFPVLIEQNKGDINSLIR